MKNVSHLGTVQENVIIGGHMTYYISCYNKKKARYKFGIISQRKEELVIGGLLPS